MASPSTASFSALHRARAATSQYRVRLASGAADLTKALRLRYEVFNLELGEGLASALQTGLDMDSYDQQCDHLLVEDDTGQIIGTYRLQAGPRAAIGLGFYSAQEFDFSPYEPLRSQVLELGRACIHRDHRSFEVLNALWRGIANYALARDARYLIGCSSLTSQDETEGVAAFQMLQPFLADEGLRTAPLPSYAIRMDQPPAVQAKIPKLLRAYLTIGAKICGPPAIDRAFKTIDFLTLLDLCSLSPSARVRYFGL